MRILPETDQVIHGCLQAALNAPQTQELLDLIETFRENLNYSIQKIPSENRSNYNLFNDGLRATHYYHLRRSEITSFAINLSITISHFAKWLDVRNAETLARFKSLMSDLRKNLELAFERAPEHSIREKKIDKLSTNVRDRLGIRLVVDTESNEDLFKIWSSFIDVFGGFNPTRKMEFVSWYTNNSEITSSHKRAIREVLSLPLFVTDYKNYVDYPKSNGYQCLQGTLNVAFYSNILPGLQFELQVRSKEMDEVAKSGSAAHQVYKQNRSVHRIISIDDPSVLLRLKTGVEDFIPLCHCFITDDKVKVIT